LVATEQERQAAREWVKLCPEAPPMTQGTLVLYHALVAMLERQLHASLEDYEKLESFARERIGRAEAALVTAQEETLLEAAGELCNLCRMGHEPRFAGSDTRNKWTHAPAGQDVWTANYTCKAAAIRQIICRAALSPSHDTGETHEMDRDTFFTRILRDWRLKKTRIDQLEAEIAQYRPAAPIEAPKCKHGQWPASLCIDCIKGVETPPHAPVEGQTHIHSMLCVHCPHMLQYHLSGVLKGTKRGCTQCDCPGFDAAPVEGPRCDDAFKCPTCGCNHVMTWKQY